MSNTLLTIGMITNEAMAVLENTLTFTKFVNREYDDQFAIKGAKIGATVNVRKPVQYIGRRTAAIQVQGTVESAVPVTLNNQYGCDTSFTSAELTLDIDQFADRILKPAIATVANMIDYDGMQQYLNIYNAVGTPGTAATALSTYLQAGVLLDNGAAPNDNMRSVVIDPNSQAVIVNALTTVFNPSNVISDQYLNGTMGRASGFKWSMDQNTARHTFGVYAANVAAGAVTVKTTITSGASIVTTGWTNGDALKAGDVFSVENVYSANPQNRQSTGKLAQFVVLANTAADVTTDMTITFAPAMVFSGQYQNVISATNSALATADISLLATTGASSAQGLAFHRDAFTFATCDLEMPNGVDMAKRVSSKKLGMSMRLVRAYDINNDRFPCRIDLLGGWATLRAELASRVAN